MKIIQAALSLLVVLFFYSQAISQIDYPPAWSAYILQSIQYDETDIEQKSAIGIGVETQLWRRQKLGAFMSLDYRQWDEYDIRILPLHVGPSYRVPLSSHSLLIASIGAGPQALVGNDFGAVFASAVARVELDIQLGEAFSMMIGAAYTEAMAFHPDHFRYLDLFVGLRF